MVNDNSYLHMDVCQYDGCVVVNTKSEVYSGFLRARLLILQDLASTTAALQVMITPQF